MPTCKDCGAALLENARFCHACGAKVAPPQAVVCSACGTENPPDARFCIHCGLNFPGQRPPQTRFEQPAFPSSPQEITDRFFDVFQQKILEEQGLEHYPAYLERFENSDFKNTFELRVRQLAQECASNSRQGDFDPTQALVSLDRSLHGLADFFIIRYCQDLNKIHIPEGILKYETVDKAKVDLYQMIRDFLDLEHSDEVFYTNFLQMPVEKLKNAGQSFLFPSADERIFFICDQSLLGTLKEGFAMTDRAIYWKAPFEKPRQVRYANLTAIVPEKEWLRINGFFFNANPTLNVRLMKLLRKMQELLA